MQDSLLYKRLKFDEIRNINMGFKGKKAMGQIFIKFLEPLAPTMDLRQFGGAKMVRTCTMCV